MKIIKNRHLTTFITLSKFIFKQSVDLYNDRFKVMYSDKNVSYIIINNEINKIKLYYKIKQQVNALVKL